ncbi:unnamed protein product [Vitrella brassicaformis CCMP3155]|uniref:RING-type domain-containing protein n=3 Tax=Vitrella brassicaformis TaxID=1169539 RepID=A0A0G4FBW3_VITBC|nr:unnamed protein product [Vitrella brassicaformis CCMP3155]|eukprot:CEM10729.1 unnamed protein product [Vitrella brassicaformis CCMP3155]
MTTRSECGKSCSPLQVHFSVRSAIDDLSSSAPLSREQTDLNMIILAEHYLERANRLQHQQHCANCKRKLQAEALQSLHNDNLLRRVLSVFTDVSDSWRQERAADLLLTIWRLGDESGTHRLARKLISVSGSPRDLIASLSRVFAEADSMEEHMESFTLMLLAEAMGEGRQRGDGAESRDYLVQRHPGALRRALSWAERHVGDNVAFGLTMVLLNNMYSIGEEYGQPLPPTGMPMFLWGGLWKLLVQVMTRHRTAHEQQHILGSLLGTPSTSIVSLLSTTTDWVRSKGSDKDKFECLDVLYHQVYPHIDTLATILTSPDARQELRSSAALCLEFIFRCCYDFVGVLFVSYPYFANMPNGPVQRLMRSPGSLEAFTQHMRKGGDGLLALVIPSLVARCGYRDEVYSSGCISLMRGISEHRARLPHSPEDDVRYWTTHFLNMVGTESGDMTDARAKIAVREGLPASLCEMVAMCPKRLSDDMCAQFVDFTIATLRALVAYGDRVSTNKRGTLRANTVTRAILQNEAVKALRAAGQPARRKGHQQTQLDASKKLLDFFAEIERAANERADAQLAAELAEFDINEGNKETPSSSKSSKKSKAKKRSKAADKNLPSVGHADKVQDGHDSLPRPASPSPQRPPLGACPPSSVSSNEPSVPPMDRSTVPQQQQGSSDDAGPFMRVGRKRRGKAAQTDQVASPLQDQWSFPGPASAPSRPSSSSSFRHHEPPVPLTPPLQPPTAPPVRHAPAAVGASSASSHAQPPAGPSAAATAATAAAAASIGGVIETKEVKCCVCLLNEPNVILLPCRHKVVCGECFDKWMAPMPTEDKICPEHTCRQPYLDSRREPTGSSPLGG